MTKGYFLTMQTFYFWCYAGTERKEIAIQSRSEWEAKDAARALATRAGWSLIEREEFDSN